MGGTESALPPSAGFYEWSPAYELGVAEMDAQHRTLVSMIDGLYLRMSEGEGAAGAAEATRNLARYAREHFSLEEAHIRRIGEERFAVHLREHAEFTSRVAQSLARLDAGERVSALDLAGYLRDWLTRHISCIDRHLADAIRGRG